MTANQVPTAPLLEPVLRRFQPIDFKTRFPALDGIRALAIGMVFLNHFGGGAHGGRALQALNAVRERCWAGVDLFFVLSGFLITGILFDTQTDSCYFFRFFARRAVRIFPVFYLVVAVVLLSSLYFHYEFRPMQAWFLIYLGNIPANRDFSLYTVMSATHPTARVFLGHFWSLCVEEQFYLLWPAVVFLVRDRVRLLRTALAICLLVLAARTWIVLSVSRFVSERWIFRSLPFRLDTLLVGAILALLLRGPNADRWQRAGKWFCLGGALPALAILTYSPGIDSPWLLSVGLTCIAISSAGLIAMTVRTASPAFKLFHLQPLRTLGRYSYGFYIYHVLYGWAWIQFLVFLAHHFHSLALGGLLAIVSNFAVSLLVSKISYDYFELRFLSLKRHFQYDSETARHEHAYSLQP